VNREDSHHCSATIETDNILCTLICPAFGNRFFLIGNKEYELPFVKIVYVQVAICFLGDEKALVVADFRARRPGLDNRVKKRLQFIFLSGKSGGKKQ
jgi:hypothetical protein